MAQYGSAYPQQPHQGYQDGASAPAQPVVYMQPYQASDDSVKLQQEENLSLILYGSTRRTLSY